MSHPRFAWFSAPVKSDAHDPTATIQPVMNLSDASVVRAAQIDVAR